MLMDDLEIEDLSNAIPLTEEELEHLIRETYEKQQADRHTRDKSDRGEKARKLTIKCSAIRESRQSGNCPPQTSTSSFPAPIPRMKAFLTAVRRVVRECVFRLLRVREES